MGNLFIERRPGGDCGNTDYGSGTFCGSEVFGKLRTEISGTSHDATSGGRAGQTRCELNVVEVTV